LRLSSRLTFVLAGATALVLAMTGAAFAMGGGGGMGTANSGTANMSTANMGTSQMSSGDTTRQSSMDESSMTQSGTTMTDGTMNQPGMTDGTMNQRMFGDTAGSWYADYADHMAENDYMHGYTNGDFGGNDLLTRGQFTATMARMMGLDLSGEAPFGDTQGYWAEGHIAAMTAAGIVNGHADGSFGPNEPITRAQMVTLMDRAQDYLGLSTPDYDPQQLQNRLADVAGHWAQDHIGHMYELGITQGDEAGNFRPDEQTIRAQAAAMLSRWHEVQ